MQVRGGVQVRCRQNCSVVALPYVRIHGTNQRPCKALHSSVHPRNLRELNFCYSFRAHGHRVVFTILTRSGLYSYLNPGTHEAECNKTRRSARHPAQNPNMRADGPCSGRLVKSRRVQLMNSGRKITSGSQRRRAIPGSTRVNPSPNFERPNLCSTTVWHPAP